MATGKLKIHVFQNDSYIPIENAKITVIQDYETTYRQVSQNLSSNSCGLTDIIELKTPPADYSMKPSDKLPYSLCDITIEALDYKKLTIKGCQIYPDVVSIQNCYLNSIRKGGVEGNDIIRISEHTLVGKYPAKIPESSQPKPNQAESSGFYFTPADWVIPESIIVHAGDPNDPAARNYTVNYKDYIKNVVASEIHCDWKEEAIKANTIAIISFTLNRLYTEWYWGKMKKFHISSSTAFDQCFVPGRTLYESINNVVDEVFSTYIEKSNYEFPLLSQYCDGKYVPPRKGWLSQWGSKDLADRGKTAEEILKFYYGPDIKLSRIKKMGDFSPSYPDYALQMGSKGKPVELIQKSLNVISKHYPLIPKLNVDGIFSDATQNSVKVFQDIFSLKKSGVVDYPTWYKISDLYVGIVGRPFDNRLIERTFIPPVFNRYDFDIPTFSYYDIES